ncbi:MAG: 16S rRNA (guanine(527)-N(7))-methyltransferase RsmG [Hyphomicrobiaceae bacterium]|nr:16S rRNA (guanine(527)-N(7))-methyltransferase RsmG [Hyphomicrobiaceae bacterium]
MTHGESGRIDGPDSFRRSFAVSRETAERLIRYEALLRQWQKAVNLVAPRTLPEVWHRHFADSAQLAPLVPEGAESLVDLGSGGGFPGLVLAIMLMERQPLWVMLVESDTRKAAFLREAARVTGATVEILSMRIENAETQRRVGRVDVVTVRALAPLSRLFGLAAPFFAPRTVGLFLKGRDILGEIDGARVGWRFDVELVQSMTDAAGQIAVVRNVSAKTEG